MDGFFVKANGGQIQVAHCPIRVCTGFPGVVAAATVFRSILFGKTHGLAFSSERRRVQSMPKEFNTGSMESKEKQP